MGDPSDLVLIGGGGMTLGGLLVRALTGLGKRNLEALDGTLKELRTAVDDLRNEVRHLRETDIAQAKDIGALQQEVRGIKERVDGMGSYWREEFRRATGRRSK